jgi:hypothetical protein
MTEQLNYGEDGDGFFEREFWEIVGVFDGDERRESQERAGAPGTEVPRPTIKEQLELLGLIQQQHAAEREEAGITARLVADGLSEDFIGPNLQLALCCRELPDGEQVLIRASYRDHDQRATRVTHFEVARRDFGAIRPGDGFDEEHAKVAIKQADELQQLVAAGVLPDYNPHFGYIGIPLGPGA